MQLIQQLEALGQSGSLKQFGTVSDMLKSKRIDDSFLNQVSSNNIELVCLVEPDDDDDDTNK